MLIAGAVLGSLAAIVALLIYITKRQGRARTKRLREEYSALLAQHNIQPSFSQVFDHRILALDARRGVFAFVQHDEKLPEAIIEMAEIADCQLWKDGIQISRKAGKRGETVEEYVSAIGLSFKRKSGIVINVPIYTEALDGVKEKIPLTKAATQWLERLRAVLSGMAGQHRQTVR
jgi:hypothetical protein